MKQSNKREDKKHKRKERADIQERARSMHSIMNGGKNGEFHNSNVSTLVLHLDYLYMLSNLYFIDLLSLMTTAVMEAMAMKEEGNRGTEAGVEAAVTGEVVVIKGGITGAAIGAVAVVIA